jgi:rubrerythrin
MNIDDDSEGCYYESSCPLCKKMELVWRCTYCGYLHHEVESPPDDCPDCGRSKEQFELVEED